MAKLYPPIIKDCVFFKDYIEVPFQHNMSVNPDGVGYALRIKTISTNKELVNIKTGVIKNNKIYFTLGEYSNKFQIGEYYKIQLAYISSSGTEGYYSSFAIARCTNKIVSYSFYKDKYIPNKFHLIVNRGSDDKDDILYTYRVWLCKLKEKRPYGFGDQATQQLFLSDIYSNSLNSSSYTVVGDTETQIINNQKDIVFDFKDIVLDYNNKYQYFLIAKITTTNGLALKTIPTLIPLIVDEDDLSSSKLYISKNFEYGYIFIRNDGDEDGYLSKKSENGYQPIKKLSAKTKTTSAGYYYDFCIEQGQIYTYALGKNKYILNDLDLAKADAVTSSGIGPIRNIRADYEDMSLWDGKKILRLKYNPQISSFKTTRPEQKTETLGSKYPFVFYNNKVGYKEFPISAFIATEMDNNDQINSYKLMKINKFNPRRETTASSHNIIYGHGQISGEDVLYAKEGDWLISYDEETSTFVKKLYSRTSSEWLTATLTENDEEAIQLLSTEINNSNSSKYLYSTESNVYLVSGVPQGPLYSIRPEKLLTIPTLEDSFIDVAEEYKNERIFKNKVMDWLNDGKPKLFRSPQEGMFIVQIMGVSMSPNDQLARKMHTVQMNAVEIAEYSYENLIKYNLLQGITSSSNRGDLLYNSDLDFSNIAMFNTLE